MQTTLVLMTALAISMDSLMVGMVYGVKRIKIPFTSLMVISLTTVFMLALSVSLGASVRQYVPEMWGQVLGASILLLLGVWGLLGARSREAGSDPAPRTIMALRLRPFGLMIQVLHEPMVADLDASGEITGGEALILGLALAIDALGAGFATGLAGIELPVLLLAAGAGNCLFVLSGMKLGAIAGKARRGLQVLPGIVLIGIGLLRLFSAY